MLNGEQLTARLRLLQTLLQTTKGGAQRVSFGPLITELLREARGHLLMADLLAQRGTGQVILLAAYGERRFTLPVARGFFVLGLFLLQQVLVGKRDGDLSLYLEELVFHIKDELAQHLLRIFGSVDQVVQIGAEQSCNSFEQCLDVTPFFFDAGKRMA